MQSSHNHHHRHSGIGYHTPPTPPIPNGSSAERPPRARYPDRRGSTSPRKRRRHRRSR